jgi:NTP pyrophosphatase (non-canonical NTP hydrolase)
MTLKEIQQTIDKMVKNWGGYYDPMTNLGLVMEELGEVARIMTRDLGGQKWKKGADKGSLEDELVDVIYSVVCIANQQGIDLDHAFQKNFEKQLGRDVSRFAS